MLIKPSACNATMPCNHMDVKKLIEEVLIDLGNNKSITEVSSKIQIIVRLLGDDKLRKWYNCEFVTGYNNEEIPDYRVTRAADIKASYIVPQGFGAWHMPDQSVPMFNLGKERYDEVMTIKLKENISSIIEYSKHPEKMAMSLSPYETALVQKVLGEVHIRSAHKVIPPSVFQTIIDNVQNRIIDLFMDLDEKVFKGELDITSRQGKKEMQQVINNYITAGVVNTGSGSIDASNSINAVNNSASIGNEVKDKLQSIVGEIERIAADHDDWLKDISQELIDIHAELQSPTPQPAILTKSFKALAWGVSVSCKAAIEKLVCDAINLLTE